MEITVKKLYLSTSPRKARPVLHGLRGMNLKDALNTMAFTNKKAAQFTYDLLKAGVAAAKENYLEADQAFVKEIFCNEGPRLKRIQPWSKGQARRITKRRSHLVLTVTDKLEEQSKKSQPKADQPVVEKVKSQNDNSEVNNSKSETKAVKAKKENK